MSFLGIPTSYQDLTNAGLVKGAVGGALEGYGAVTGNQTASQVGHNVTSPVVNAQGIANPAYSAGSQLAGFKAPGLNPNSAGLTYASQAPKNSGGAGSGGGVAPDPNQAAVDQQTSFLQQALGQLPGQLQVAQGNINGQYGQNLNELNTGEQQAQGQYDQGTNQNTQNYVTNKNQINDQASSGLHALLGLLGLHGAGGSSDALYSAPQAVATQASQQRAGAGQTYGQNQQGLDTNWNNYQTGFNQSKQKLSDWLSQNLNQAQATSDTTRQGLLQQIAGIQPSTAAAQPFLDQSNALNNEVTNLGKLNPTYTGTAPVYNAPSVASYTVNPNAPIQQQNSALDSTTSPFLSLLLGNQKDKQQQPAF